ncbi:hypothetical protein J2778_004869 [Paraburkholderia graminis]|nr:hypothetical protein [Paraburkholderia graminis]
MTTLAPARPDRFSLDGTSPGPANAEGMRKTCEGPRKGGPQSSCWIVWWVHAKLMPVGGRFAHLRRWRSHGKSGRRRSTHHMFRDTPVDDAAVQRQPRTLYRLLEHPSSSFRSAGDALSRLTISASLCIRDPQSKSTARVRVHGRRQAIARAFQKNPARPGVSCAPTVRRACTPSHRQQCHKSLPGTDSLAPESGSDSWPRFHQVTQHSCHSGGDIRLTGAIGLLLCFDNVGQVVCEIAFKINSSAQRSGPYLQQEQDAA